ncbi:hypothetical protein ADK70_26955 [Streptomyces rimosus subsp. pseudoverticillatus]|uniref:hypothetical protein n=1 Tax=Streptomyces rimosus TaxID=1927 RepID=UPI0006B26666|nr:hypothetical protein [Streptomyces rimosus]KOT80899.1 hypothetical protein ADK70_26955 [Streptomyces rimosus subsp. pseudoverticillatus]
MEDYELGDGSSTRPFPPTAWEVRRRAAYEAVDVARWTRLGSIKPPTPAERRIAGELADAVDAMRAAWYVKDNRLPPLAHRMQMLTHAGQLVRALAETVPAAEVDADLRQALERVTEMCTPLEAALTGPETYLQQHARRDELDSAEQRVYPIRGEPDNM